MMLYVWWLLGICAVWMAFGAFIYYRGLLKGLGGDQFRHNLETPFALNFPWRNKLQAMVDMLWAWLHLPRWYVEECYNEWHEKRWPKPPPPVPKLSESPRASPYGEQRG